MKSQKPKEHYVNNKEFLAEMVKYKEMCAKAEKRGRRQPPITNYMGECFLKIANHLSYRPNFINYTYKDDMISDGIENCLQYVANFNPEKSNNPFAYFTQIIYYAFIRRIQKEKKQQHVKHKIIENMTVLPEFADMAMEDDKETGLAYVDYLQKNYLPDEDVYKPKKKKTKPKGLEQFYDEEQGEEVDEDSADN